MDELQQVEPHTGSPDLIQSLEEHLTHAQAQTGLWDGDQRWNEDPMNQETSEIHEEIQDCSYSPSDLPEGYHGRESFLNGSSVQSWENYNTYR